MNYTQAIAWLYGTQLHGVKLGLEQIHRLLDELGVEGGQQRFIHVAGTNGKGSVCAMLDAICREQGIRTGLFTSPHLVHFCERIKLDGRTISEQEVASGLTTIQEIVTGWETHPTFFEITTALALYWFQRVKADIVVLETGLGGRLDSTNVVTPLVSVLTPIDLDHQAWLGSSLGEIALEKAGIIKPGVPVVSAPQHEEVAEVFIRSAAEKGAAIQFITEPLENYPINLAGSHQKFNASLAIAALRSAGVRVSEEAIRKGLDNVIWPGRFQVIHNQIVLDGAHNEAAAQRLVLTWREVYGEKRATIILGVLKDKDMTAICRALMPIASAFIVTHVRSQRSSSPEELQQIIRELNASIPCSIAADLTQAIEIAKPGANPVLITGSLFLVGEALAFFDEASSKPEISEQ
ncbi:MAG: folylpolyglutamate synthase/dihydrofolate synthase family protein [Chthoniobacteraceae bacterium]